MYFWFLMDSEAKISLMWYKSQGNIPEPLGTGSVTSGSRFYWFYFTLSVRNCSPSTGQFWSSLILCKRAFACNFPTFSLLESWLPTALPKPGCWKWIRELTSTEHKLKKGTKSRCGGSKWCQPKTMRQPNGSNNKKTLNNIRNVLIIHKECSSPILGFCGFKQRSFWASPVGFDKDLP